MKKESWKKIEKVEPIVPVAIIVVGVGLLMGWWNGCNKVCNTVKDNDVDTPTQTAPVPTRRAVADTMLVVGADNCKNYKGIMAIDRDGQRRYFREHTTNNPNYYTNVGDTILVGGVKKNILKNITLERRCAEFARTKAVPQKQR